MENAPSLLKAQIPAIYDDKNQTETVVALFDGPRRSGISTLAWESVAGFKNTQPNTSKKVLHLVVDSRSTAPKAFGISTEDAYSKDLKEVLGQRKTLEESVFHAEVWSRRAKRFNEINSVDLIFCSGLEGLADPEAAHHVMNKEFSAYDLVTIDIGSADPSTQRFFRGLSNASVLVHDNSPQSLEESKDMIKKNTQYDIERVAARLFSQMPDDTKKRIEGFKSAVYFFLDWNIRANSSMTLAKFIGHAAKLAESPNAEKLSLDTILCHPDARRSFYSMDAPGSEGIISRDYINLIVETLTKTALTTGTLDYIEVLRAFREMSFSPKAIGEKVRKVIERLKIDPKAVKDHYDKTFIIDKRNLYEKGAFNTAMHTCWADQIIRNLYTQNRESKGANVMVRYLVSRFGQIIGADKVMEYLKPVVIKEQEKKAGRDFDPDTKNRISQKLDALKQDIHSSTALTVPQQTSISAGDDPMEKVFESMDKEFVYNGMIDYKYFNHPLSFGIQLLKKMIEDNKDTLQYLSELYSKAQKPCYIVQIDKNPEVKAANRNPELLVSAKREYGARTALFMRDPNKSPYDTTQPTITRNPILPHLANRGLLTMITTFDDYDPNAKGIMENNQKRLRKECEDEEPSMYRRFATGRQASSLLKNLKEQAIILGTYLASLAGSPAIRECSESIPETAKLPEGTGIRQYISRLLAPASTQP